MGLTASWVLAAVCVVGAVLAGIRFRGGKHRWFVAAYRSPSLPAAYRNLLLVAPFAAIAIVPTLVMLAPNALGVTVQVAIPHRIALVLALVVLACLIGGGGLVCIFLVRPPRWLIPRWLRDEDTLLGFRPPRPDWFDRGTLLLGVLGLLMGLGLVVVAGLELAGLV